MELAKKTATNPFFNSNYADLSDVLEVLREPLAENELAVVQMPVEDVKGTALITTLTHSSGEWFRSKLYITPKAKDAQSVGSAITYARRYALSAITGVGAEDDDGEKAVRPAGKPAQSDDQHENVPMTMEMNRLIKEITDMVGKMCDGDEKKMEEYLQGATTWTDKKTNTTKSLSFKDLPSVAARKPNWMRTIYKKVTDSFFLWQHQK